MSKLRADFGKHPKGMALIFPAVSATGYEERTEGKLNLQKKCCSIETSLAMTGLEHIKIDADVGAEVAFPAESRFAACLKTNEDNSFHFFWCIVM